MSKTKKFKNDPLGRVANLLSTTSPIETTSTVKKNPEQKEDTIGMVKKCLYISQSNEDNLRKVSFFTRKSQTQIINKIMQEYFLNNKPEGT